MTSAHTADAAPVINKQSPVGAIPIQEDGNFRHFLSSRRETFFRINIYTPGVNVMITIFEDFR
jgi:hypothetical protein